MSPLSTQSFFIYLTFLNLKGLKEVEPVTDKFIEEIKKVKL